MFESDHQLQELEKVLEEDLEAVRRARIILRRDFVHIPEPSRTNGRKKLGLKYNIEDIVKAHTETGGILSRTILEILQVSGCSFPNKIAGQKAISGVILRFGSSIQKKSDKRYVWNEK